MINSCISKDKTLIITSGENYSFTYELNAPDQCFKLPPELEEVSGIACINNNQLVSIQDEKGVIYGYDLSLMTINFLFSFAVNGDYEDISVHKDTIWVIESNGNIYEISNSYSESRKVKKILTSLTRRNDAEGLEFNYETKELWIACKNAPTDSSISRDQSHRVIYRFDIAEKELKKGEEILLNLSEIRPYKNSKLKSFSIKLAKKLKIMHDDIQFQPSGVAIHPVTREIFILSANHPWLILLNKQLKVIEVLPLDTRLFLQPEGICFSSDGVLYISSEGKGSGGYVLQFNAKKDGN